MIYEWDDLHAIDRTQLITELNLNVLLCIVRVIRTEYCVLTVHPNQSLLDLQYFNL